MSEKSLITLNDFTPEIKAKIPEYIERAIEGVFDGGRYHNFNYDNAKAAVDNIYEFCGYKKPEVIVAENPYEAHMKYYDLLDEHNVDYGNERKYVNMYLFALNVYSDSYYSYYKFIKDEFNVKVTGVAKRLDEFYNLQKKSGIYSAIFLQDVCIISKYPTKIHRDEENRLHNVEGVAVEWGSSKPEWEWKSYYIHGRNIDVDFFEKVKSGNYSKEEFIKETNEERKAAAYEIMGQEKFLKFIEAKKIDEGQFVHNDGNLETVELYKTDFTIPEIGNNPLAWVKFICPSTGTSYFIDVEPHHTDAREAAISTSPFYGDGIENVDDYKYDKRS